MMMEDTIMNWAFNHMPTIAVCILLIAAAVWITVRVIDYRNRLRQVELDSKEMKKDVKSLKKSVARIDRRLTRLEEKIGGLITFLTTKKIDFKD